MKLSLKVVALVSCAMVGALTLSVVVAQDEVRTSIQQSIGQNQSQSASQTMDKIDRFLYERMVDLDIMANAGQFLPTTIKQSSLSDTLALQALNNIKTFDGVWSSLSILDASQHQLISTDPTAFSASDRAKTQQALNLALDGEIDSSNVFRSSNGQVSQYYFAPIRSPKTLQVSGVIVGKLAWPAVLEIIQGVKTGTVLLVNAQGVEIGTNDFNLDNILIKNISKTSVFRSVSHNTSTQDYFTSLQFDNVKNPLIAFAKEQGYLDYVGHGWYLINAVPATQVFLPAHQASVSLLLTFGIIMLIALLLILLFLQRQIIRPILILSSAVKGITRGDWSQQLHIKSHDELGDLGTAFNAMSAQLSTTSAQLADEKAQLEASINSLQLGFILINQSNQIITMNPPAQEMLGFKNAHDEDSDLEHGFSGAVLVETAACLKKQKTVTKNYTTPKGRFMKLFVSPVIKTGKAIGAVALVEDITETKVMERSREEFFSIASHELRTPLTAIRGNASMIQQFYGDKMKHDQNFNELVDDIHSSSVRLIGIVNDFLDASRLEQGKMVFNCRPFNISEVIEGVVYEMSVVIKEKKLYIKTDKTLHDLPLVYADKDRVKQIIYNLVGNALKFTDQGGITITAEPSGHNLRVSITDTGSGIPTNKQALLFRKFQQAGNSILTRDTTRGTGLGLYISKLLVEKMDGKLKMEGSEVGKGTTFSFYLPFKPPAHSKFVKSQSKT